MNNPPPILQQDTRLVPKEKPSMDRRSKPTLNLVDDLDQYTRFVNTNFWLSTRTRSIMNKMLVDLVGRVVKSMDLGLKFLGRNIGQQNCGEPVTKRRRINFENEDLVNCMHESFYNEYFSKYGEPIERRELCTEAMLRIRTVLPNPIEHEGLLGPTTKEKMKQYLMDLFAEELSEATAERTMLMDLLAQMLTTLIEYIALEWIRDSGSYASELKSHCICKRHFRLAISFDPEFYNSAFYEQLGLIEDFPLENCTEFPTVKTVTFQSGSTVAFSMLTADLHVHVLQSFDNVTQLMQMRLVCKHWNNLILDSNSIWMYLTYHSAVASPFYPLITSKLTIDKFSSMVPSDASWHWIYMDRIYRIQQTELEVHEAIPNLDQYAYRVVCIQLLADYENVAGLPPPEGLMHSVGESKIGGDPDVPIELPRKWKFRLQFNLRDLHKQRCICHGGYLPDTGLLLFFVGQCTGLVVYFEENKLQSIAGYSPDAPSSPIVREGLQYRVLPYDPDQLTTDGVCGAGCYSILPGLLQESLDNIILLQYQGESEEYLFTMSLKQLRNREFSECVFTRFSRAPTVDMYVQ